MKVIFIVTPVFELNDDCAEPPLGILYLATILRKNNIPCVICDLSGLPENQWLDNLEFGDIYAFSTYSVTYHRTLKIKELIKRKLNQKAITIAGGPHITAIPQECLSDFDIVIPGEAEDSFLEAITKIRDNQNLSGIFYKEPPADLDLLPFPNYDMVDLKRYHRLVEGKPSVSLLSSRGCPFNCAFCNSRISSRGKVRFRSPSNVVEEIKFLKNKYGITNFRFSDDLFSFSKKRIEEMSGALTPLNILYRIFAQAKGLAESKNAVKLLYDSGCRHVAVGIESMSRKMLKFLGKSSTVEENASGLQNAKAAGLKVRIYLMIGFPGETEKTVRESLKILLDCAFDEFIVYSFIPYPGTPVWYNPEKWGITKIDRDFSKYVQVGRERSTCFVVETKDFTADDVRRWREFMINELEKKFIWAGESRENK